MIIAGLAIGELTGETVVAMYGCGRKVDGTIQGHQPLVAKDPNMRQQAGLLPVLKNLNTYRIKGARGERIEPLTDLLVTGHLLHAQQGMDVIGTCGVLQPAGTPKTTALGCKRCPRRPRRHLGWRIGCLAPLCAGQVMDRVDNAGAHLLSEAAATQERRLEAVRCSAL